MKVSEFAVKKRSGGRWQGALAGLLGAALYALPGYVAANDGENAFTPSATNDQSSPVSKSKAQPKPRPKATVKSKAKLQAKAKPSVPAQTNKIQPATASASKPAGSTAAAGKSVPAPDAKVASPQQAVIPVSTVNPLIITEVKPATVLAAVVATDDNYLQDEGVVPAGAASSGDDKLLPNLVRVLAEHPLIKVADDGVSEANERIDVERSGWYPKVGVSADKGVEKTNTTIQGQTDGTFHPWQAGISADQLLWDFGTTNARITRAEQNLSVTQLELDAQRQGLLFSGLDAHLKLIRAQQVLGYARQNETSLTKQTHLEDLRIGTGRGYTTDYLQAKGQLENARARRVAGESGVDTALSAYRTVFGSVEVNLNALDPVREAEGLPTSLEEVLSLVETNNPDYLVAKARAGFKAAERDEIYKTQWMPRVGAVAQAKNRNNYDGIVGRYDDKKVMVQATWDYTFGGKATHETDAATYAAAAELNKADYTELQSKQAARDAWTDLLAARERLTYLTSQVEINKRFLNLARKEREIGRRSLLDVLNGEVNLVNAQSELAVAQTDEVIASYGVLRAIGRLTLPSVQVASNQQ